MERLQKFYRFDVPDVIFWSNLLNSKVSIVFLDETRGKCCPFLFLFSLGNGKASKNSIDSMFQM